MSSILMRNRAARHISRVEQIKKPRSVFPVNFSRKMSMKASYLYPIRMIEIEPGDTWDLDLTHYMRLATQVTAPIDNLIVNVYAFFVPYRLVWDNFVKQHGEQDNPDDTTDYITPTITAGNNGFGFKTIYDYMGGINVTAKGNKVSALPFRAYNMIWNQFFRDEKLQDSVTLKKDDSDDNPNLYTVLKKGKMRDYFVNATPDIVAGGEGVTLPIGSEAPVVGTDLAIGFSDGTRNFGFGPTTNTENNRLFKTEFYGVNAGDTISGATGYADVNKALGVTKDGEKSGLVAKLNEAVGAQISAVRLAIHTQELLENDMKWGSRYTEQLQHRYGCINPDLRLQRAQYLGGLSCPLFTNPVVQTSESGTTAQGNIAGYGTTGDKGNIIKASFGEFGCVLVLCSVQAVPQYQYGTHRKWTRFKRFDYMYPELNGLSDQAIKNKEIYTQDNDVVDPVTGEEVNEQTWGYIGRYDELRYQENEICGELRSDYPQSLDVWHYAEPMDELQNLNGEFIEDKTDEILKRSLAVQNDEEETAEQLIVDFEYKGAMYRMLPAVAKPTISSILG